MNASNAVVSVPANAPSADDAPTVANRGHGKSSQRPTMTLVSSNRVISRTPITREEAVRQAILRTG